MTEHVTLALPRNASPETRRALLDGPYLEELYASRTLLDTARLLGIGQDTLRRALLYHGIALHKRGEVIDKPNGHSGLTRSQLRRIVLRLYWTKADRCPPDCPGRYTCIDPGAACTLDKIVQAEPPRQKGSS